MQSPSIARISTGARAALILALALSLVGASPAQARANLVGPATWYVAPTGLDTNSCLAFDAPCLTINGAIGKAAAGDTVKVAIGTYGGIGTEVVLIDRNITLLGGWDETFSAQTGLSSIDGEEARRGVYVNDYLTAAIDHFAIKYGVADYTGGGGILTRGKLTLSSSVVSDNSAESDGGGISNAVNILTVNDSTIMNNSAPYGAGISNYAGVLIINNSTLSGNTVPHLYGAGSAIHTRRGATLNNTTVSGNKEVEAIAGYGHGAIFLNNSTVVDNPRGGITIEQYTSGVATLRNSILARNTSGGGHNCVGSLVSAGYNLIGSKTADCILIGTTGDKIGRPLNPIDPMLTPLADHGGRTLTYALMAGSPALDAGNPAAPGSEENACLTTDQRGVARPVDSVCDMGAVEGRVAGVVSITRLDASPTSALSARFQVTFSEAVTGVDTAEPFDDFSLTTTGITGGSITSVSGSDSIYTVTVNTGSNNGTLRLNVVDNDSILDSSSTPLGTAGAGNGDYMTGQAYTIRKIPAAIVPATSTWDPTPTFKWLKIPAATQYQYQLFKGTTLVYSKSVPASACGATTCQNTPTTILPYAPYKWRVRAMSYGAWKPFSPYKTFSLLGARAGYWKGYGNDFYVTPTRTSVDDFSIYISVTGCGNYKISYTNLTPIVNGKFKFTGAFYASGTFNSPTSASGQVGLKYYYIPGCGYISGLVSWSAAWWSSAQPDPAMDAPSLLLLPELDAPLVGPFTVAPLP